MTSLKDYVNTVRSIAVSQNIHGDTVEMLAQMLGYFLYVSEVEQVAYTQEASLSRATQMNSKIQHCLDMMYSVYRGSNPRVIINFIPTKVFTFNRHDEIISSNTFKVYYLGYIDLTSDTKEIIYSDTTIYPSDSPKAIVGLISKEVVGPITWSINSTNPYYQDILDDNIEMSSDSILKMSSSDDNYKEIFPTRIFSDHTLNNKIFDLTMPGWGTRLMYPPKFTEYNCSRSEYSSSDLKFYFKCYGFLSYSSLNTSEIRNLKMSGAKNSEITVDSQLYTSHPGKEEFLKYGLILFEESNRDESEILHYKANQNRFTGTYSATNSDLSFLLAEIYPDKVRLDNGTSVQFDQDSNTLKIFYIPQNRSNLLTNKEIDSFKKDHCSYYVTKSVDISPGTVYIANFEINLNLYTNKYLTDDIQTLLSPYQYKFNQDLGDANNKTVIYNEILSLITKISEVKFVNSLDITYKTPAGDSVSYEEIAKNLDKSYFEITFNINSILK